VFANPPSWMSRMRAEQFKAFYAFVDEIGIPLPELGLRFVASNADIDCVLMGANNAREAEANIAAFEKGPLPKDIIKRLDDIAAMVPLRPYGEPLAMGGALQQPGADSLTRMGMLV